MGMRENAGMLMNIGGVILLLASFVVTFVAARFLGAQWRARRRKRQQDAARAGESRQVRRARERSESK
jgi:hypothetical protein